MLNRVSANVRLLRTARLRLEPVTVTLVQAILAGDLSGVSPAPGWPHEHTAAGLAHALQPGHPPGWLITAAGEVIGDCGTHGAPDEHGCVEIGYGLAASYRGRGFGSEAVAAVTAWLAAQPEITRVRACTAVGNMASRRVLEKAGYRLAGHSTGHGECVYEHP
jgi:RimJ/RimL family protein N-acetyltransferase